AAKQQIAQVEAADRQEIKQAAQASPPIPGAVAFQKLQLGYVKAAAQVSDPVTIAERASIPAGPISPKPKQDAAIGVVLGLMFGLISAFIKDSLDRRLHSAAEIQEQLGMPVLGRVSETAFGFAGLANNGHAMDEGDFEAFRVLRMNLSYLAQP